MNEMRTASIALAAYFASSADSTDMTSVRSSPKLSGAYTSRSCASDFASDTPNTVRCGSMKSGSARPSAKNSGFDATRNVAARPTFIAVSRKRAASFFPVPTGTVDFVTIKLSAGACCAIVSAAVNKYERSEEPSDIGGVPTARNCTSPCDAATAGSLVKRSLPSAIPFASSSSIPGS